MTPHRLLGGRLFAARREYAAVLATSPIVPAAITAGRSDTSDQSDLSDTLSQHHRRSSNDAVTWANACLPRDGVRTYTDFYGRVRTLAAVLTAATIRELTLWGGGVKLVGCWQADRCGTCRHYQTWLAPHHRPLDYHRRLRTHPYISVLSHPAPADTSRRSTAPRRYLPPAR